MVYLWICTERKVKDRVFQNGNLHDMTDTYAVNGTALYPADGILYTLLVVVGGIPYFYCLSD